MSRVTNVFLFFQVIENKAERMQEVNAFFGDRAYDRLVLIDDPELDTKWYGGSKGFELNCAAAAINHLDIQAFLEHLRTNVQWENTDTHPVQVALQDQHDDQVSLITVCCRKPPGFSITCERCGSADAFFWRSEDERKLLLQCHRCHGATDVWDL